MSDEQAPCAASGARSTDPGHHQRQELRFNCVKTGVSVVPLDSGQKFAAEITEASRSGIRLTTPRILQVGSMVEVELRALLIKAEVRYCRKTMEGLFEVGLYTVEAAGPSRLA